jgi:hypothetical protein
MRFSAQFIVNTSGIFTGAGTKCKYSLLIALNVQQSQALALTLGKNKLGQNCAKLR